MQNVLLGTALYVTDGAECSVELVVSERFGNGSARLPQVEVPEALTVPPDPEFVAPFPAVGVYRHSKSGNLYTVLGGVVYPNNPDQLLVLYRLLGNPEGQWYLRTISDFVARLPSGEARFEWQWDRDKSHLSAEAYGRGFFRLAAAIHEHRSQKADDRCIEDDDRLYAALGDGIACDRSVGSKEEMLKNCRRFVENRCVEGKWRTYAETERLLEAAKVLLRKASEDGKYAGIHGTSTYRGILDFLQEVGGAESKTQV